MTLTDERLDELERAAREAAEAAPGEWLADMSRYHLIAPGKTLALCATGPHLYKVLPYLAEAAPAVVLSLLSELRTLRVKAAELAEIRHRMGAPRT